MAVWVPDRGLGALAWVTLKRGALKCEGLWGQRLTFQGHGSDPGQEGQVNLAGGGRPEQALASASASGLQAPRGHNTETPVQLVFGGDPGTQEQLRAQDDQKARSSVPYIL